MSGDREAGGNEKASEIEGIPGVGIGASGGQPLVLRYMTGRPRPNEYSSQRDRPADKKSQKRGSGKNQVKNAEEEPEGQPEPLGNLRISQSASSLSRCRAITSL